MNVRNLFKCKYKTYETADGFKYKFDPKTLLEYKEFKIRKIWILLTSVVLLICIAVQPLSSNQVSNIFRSAGLLKKQVPKLTEQTLLDSLISWDVYFPELVVKQMKLETAGFTSNLYKNTNNLMGMGYPYKRKTTATGKYKSGKYNYAMYDNWVESAKDYTLYQKEYFTEKYYHIFLNNCNYAEDTSYTDKL